MMNGSQADTELPGGTWRRLKSCAEYRRFGTPVAHLAQEDQVKTLGLLQCLHDGRTNALHDEAFQEKVGRFLLEKLQRLYPDATADEAVAHGIYVLVRSVDTERWIPKR